MTRVAAVLVLAGCASGDRTQVKPVPAPAATAAQAPAPPAPVQVELHSASGTGTATEAPAARADSIEMTFAGDVMFGRFIEGGFRAIKAEQLDPFAEIEPLLASDLALVNLETPVVRDPPTKPKYGHFMRFVTSPERVATLLRHGVRHVTSSNNHYWDMKEGGAVETQEVLAEMGITAIGAPRREPPWFRVDTVIVNGWRVGFIAGATECNTDWDRAALKIPWAQRPDIGKAMLPAIKAARADHDLVIPVLHWGKEYLDAPERWQVTAAHSWIDAGADVVIAHHPHVIQGIERYKTGLIAYSLGNLLFDNTSSNRKWGGVLRLTFARDAADAPCLRAANFNPVLVVPTPGHHATIAKDGAFKAIASRLITTSKDKAIKKTEWTIDGDRLTTPGACP